MHFNQNQSEKIKKTYVTNSLNNSRINQNKVPTGKKHIELLPNLPR